MSSSGAEALKRALSSAGNPASGGGAAQPRRRPGYDVTSGAEELENHLVDEAFRLLTPVVKGWLRSRVRAGSTLVESVANLSQMLTAGQSILNAAGGIAKAVHEVTKVAARRGKK